MVAERSIRVLIVDDDPDDIFLIQDTIGEVADHRFEIEVTTSPIAAVKLLATQPFDAILCDYRLGALNGVDFIKELRAAGIDVPVLVLTGVRDQTIDAAALKAGAADFLAKSELSPAIIDRAIRYSVANAERQRLLSAVLNNTDAAVAVIDWEGRPTLWNPTFAALAGSYARMEASLAVAVFARDILRAEDKDITVGERTVERRQTCLPDGRNLLLLHDVTERVSALKEREVTERRILHMALNDSLTEIPNRAAFNELCDKALAEATDRSRLALLSMDLNKFKEVNDVFGHAVGDRLLAMVATRLRGCLADGQFAARLGGDEFVAVSPLNDDDGRAEDLAGRIRDALVKQPFEIDGCVLRIGVSIGIAFFPEHGDDREQLLVNADLAMYRAKARRDNSICFFEASMDSMVREHRAIGVELKDALVEGSIELHYQPQTSVAERRLLGFEALARWHTPTRGIVPPSTFVAIAEESGMIVPLGEQVLRMACRAAAGWPAPLKVAVNVSATQICHSDLVDLVRATLVETGLSPHRLELEITESVLIDDHQRALHVLRQLKALGVSVAMDDFGTGYSSLSALQSFPFDKIKIDRSFVERVGKQKQAAAILRAVLSLGRSLDIPVLAEGVETEEQVRFLHAEGCAEMQGYLISEPVAGRYVMDFIASRVRLEQPPQARPRLMVVGG